MKICILFLLSLLQVTVLAQAHKEEADSLIRRADSLLTRKQYPEARQMAELALKTSSQAPLYHQGMADGYMRIGQVLKKEGAFAEALGYYRKALRIRENILKNPVGVARTYANMVTAEVEIDSTRLALIHAQRAESIYLAQRSLVSDSLRAMLYIGMANIYKALDSFDVAIAISKKGATLFALTRDTLTQIKTEYTLSQILIEQEKYDEATLHLDTALIFFRGMREPDSLLLGQVYEARGVIEMRKHPSDPDRVIEYFEQAKALFLHLPTAKANLTNVYFNLGEAYENKGELDQANAYYRLAEGAGGEMSDQLDFPQLIESRVENTDANIKKQKLELWLTMALVSLLIALLITILSIYLKEKNYARANKMLYLREKENAQANELLYIREKENATLREQMFLLRHDIVKNFLQVVENQIADNTPENTDKTFEEIKYLISRLFAQIGYGDAVGKSPATLREFVTEMQLWAGIVARMPVINATFWNDLPDLPLSAALREELEMIITEAFTNIRKYAFDAGAEPKIASLRFEYLFDKGLIITIEDQGKGFAPASVERSGLHNMEVRISRINGRLDIQSIEGQGTIIKLVLPNFPDTQ